MKPSGAFEAICQKCGAPNQPVAIKPTVDPRDWSGDKVWGEPSAFATFTEQSQEGELASQYNWFTRFIDHPATRWVTFLAMCVLGGAYAIWKGGL